MKKTPKQQDQFKVSERNGQLVFALNSEKMIPENAPVRPASAMLEELDYEKLYGAYSPLGKKSAADPRVLFKVLVFWYMCGIYSSRKLERLGEVEHRTVFIDGTKLESRAGRYTFPLVSSPARPALQEWHRNGKNGDRKISFFLSPLSILSGKFR